MILGLDIDVWYIILLSALTFVLFMVGIAWVVNEVKLWRVWRKKGDNNATNSDKSGR